MEMKELRMEVKDLKVKDLIDILSKVDQNSPVRIVDPQFESTKEITKIEYDPNKGKVILA